MATRNLPSNSNKSKQIMSERTFVDVEPNEIVEKTIIKTEDAKGQPEKIQPILKKRPVMRERSAIEEGVRSTGSFLLTDVLLPAVKDLLVSLVSNGINMLVYGDSKPPRGVTRAGTKSYYTPYNRYSATVYDDDEPPWNRRERRPGRDVYSPYRFRDYLIPSRQEAEEILEGLGEIMDEYGNVSVNDLFELMDVDTVYTDAKYGWTTRDVANRTCIKQVRGGYILDLPRPREIDY